MPHEPGSTIKPVVKLPKDPADCWTWLSSVSSAGHAQKTVAGKAMPAARWMWSQLFGAIPKGMVIFHACGNKACVNPHHLRCGFQADANRSGPGTSLTPCDVRELRSIPASDRTPNRAHVEAERMGVTVGNIREVWAGSSWKKRRPNHGPKHKQRSAA